MIKGMSYNPLVFAQYNFTAVLNLNTIVLIFKLRCDTTIVYFFYKKVRVIQFKKTLQMLLS